MVVVSSATATPADHDLVEDAREFLSHYYREEIGTLAGKYPQDQSSLWVDWHDLFQYDPGIADDLLEHPDRVLDALDQGLAQVDLPVDITLDGATVRVYNLDEGSTFQPPELRAEHGGQYVSITGVLDRITGADDRPLDLVYECQRCGYATTVPQTGDDLQEPYQCESCERQGPFQIDHQKSEWTDYSKLRVKVPPEQTGSDNDHLDGYVMGELIEHGGERGLIGRNGEDITITGVLERTQKDGTDAPIFDRRLRVRAITFGSDDEDIDVKAHRDEFEALAAEDDVLDEWAASLAPNLYATDSLKAARRLSVAYLFGAPRIDIPNGPTFRGDIHVLLDGDYGTGKSTLARDVNLYSPDCVHKSATGLSSDTGLLSAATKDDFGAGQWTIQPGLLVKQNGGHLVLEEIDKTEADLSKMNDALEGRQEVDVDKAGESMTYQSRVGLYATANPVDDRFDPYEAIAPQLGLENSFLSRFDGIVTFQDRADEDLDAKIADAQGQAYVEAQEAEFGDRESFDVLERPVPVDVGRAWIQYARDEITPQLSLEHVESIRDWYASEVRQLNQSFASDEGDGRNMPVPATPRVVENTLRIAVAFARVKLQDEVTSTEVEAAKDLSRQLVANNWDGEQFDANLTQGSTTQSQRERRDTLKEVVRDLQPSDSGGGAPVEDVVQAVVETTGADHSRVENDVEKLKRRGELYEPRHGEVRSS